MEKKLSDFIVQYKNAIPEDKYNQFIKLLEEDFLNLMMPC